MLYVLNNHTVKMIGPLVTWIIYIAVSYFALPLLLKPILPYEMTSPECSYSQYSNILQYAQTNTYIHNTALTHP